MKMAKRGNIVTSDTHVFEYKTLDIQVYFHEEFDGNNLIGEGYTKKFV